MLLMMPLFLAFVADANLLIEAVAAADADADADDADDVDASHHQDALDNQADSVSAWLA